MKHSLILLALIGTSAAQAALIDFEDISLSSGASYTGADGAGGFTSGGAGFNNSYTDWGGGFATWDGFAVSSLGQTIIDQADIDDGLFSSYEFFSASGGAASGSNFAIGFVNNVGLTPEVSLPAGLYAPQSIAVTNTLWTWASMTHGDAFAKQFGTEPNPNDYLFLTIEGLDASGNVIGSVDTYLADFRDPDPAAHFILDEWTEVDLTSIGADVSKLRFTLTSSDNGVFGMNTPAYFAMDNLVVVPEPSEWAVFAGVLAVALAVARRRRD